MEDGNISAIVLSGICSREIPATRALRKSQNRAYLGRLSSSRDSKELYERKGTEDARSISQLPYALMREFSPS